MRLHIEKTINQANTDVMDHIGVALDKQKTEMELFTERGIRKALEAEVKANKKWGLFF